MDKKIKIIAVLFLIGAFLIPGSIAMYKRGAGGNSELTSANWNVTLTPISAGNSVTVIPELATATYTLEVRSSSEVDIKYAIVVSGLPSGVEASLNGVDYPPVSNGTVTFSNAGTILYNAATKANSHTLTFRGVNGATVVSNQQVNIGIVAEQLLTS